MVREFGETGQNDLLVDKALLTRAEKLSSSNQKHLKRTAEIIKAGGVVAFPFNGIYGLFGDVDEKEVAEKIFNAKNRPRGQQLILVSHPDNIEDYVNFRKVHFAKQPIIDLWKSIHALGIIFPASTAAPYHLVVREDIDTILGIWTHYQPLIEVMKHFRKLGGRAFVGTSANKSGRPTHYLFESLWKEFYQDVDALVEADFSHLSPERYKSTSIIDLTNSYPRLHRLGNVGELELREYLNRYGFPELQILRDVIQVRGSVPQNPIH